MSNRHDVRHYPGAGIVTAVFFLWLYAPIAVVIWFSFNENRLVSVWTGFSTQWYAAALSNKALLDALKVSLTVALAGNDMGQVRDWVADLWRRIQALAQSSRYSPTSPTLSVWRQPPKL